MGVKHLWRVLERGGAVEVLDGGDAAQHEQILDELEGTVVAVDLSAWLMQAISQPALTQVYFSDHACVLKVVFDRVRAAGLHRWTRTAACALQRAAAASLAPADDPARLPLGPPCAPTATPAAQTPPLPHCAAAAAPASDHPLAAPWRAAPVCG